MSVESCFWSVGEKQFVRSKKKLLVGKKNLVGKKISAGKKHLSVGIFFLVEILFCQLEKNFLSVGTKIVNWKKIISVGKTNFSVGNVFCRLDLFLVG